MPEPDTQTWESVAGKMPELLSKLRSSKLLARDNRDRLPEVPEEGIYVFYESDIPIYVGRTNRMRDRLQEHSRPSSGHNSATFAYLLATETVKRQGNYCAPQKRADLEKDPAFRSIFDEAKARVRQMPVRVVKVTDAIEQTIFEVYAALMLGTTVQQDGYNDFKNH